MGPACHLLLFTTLVFSIFFNKCIKEKIKFYNFQALVIKCSTFWNVENKSIKIAFYHLWNTSSSWI